MHKVEVVKSLGFILTDGQYVLKNSGKYYFVVPIDLSEVGLVKCSEVVRYLPWPDRGDPGISLSKAMLALQVACVASLHREAQEVELGLGGLTHQNYLGLVSWLVANGWHRVTGNTLRKDNWELFLSIPKTTIQLSDNGYIRASYQIDSDFLKEQLQLIQSSMLEGVLSRLDREIRENEELRDKYQALMSWR